MTAARPVDAPAEPDVRRHAAPRDPRSPWLIAAAVAVVAVIVLAFVVLALLPAEERRATPGTSPTTTAPESPTPSPTPTPSATDPAGQLAALRTLIAERVEAGEIDAEAERKLNEELDKIEEELTRGRPEEAADRIEELQDKLDELTEEDRITESAAKALSTALDDLAELLPDPEDKGRGKGKKKDDD